MTTLVTIRSQVFCRSYAARVPNDQHGHQPDQYGRDHPGGLHPVAGWERHMQAGRRR